MNGYGDVPLGVECAWPDDRTAAASARSAAGRLLGPRSPLARFGSYSLFLARAKRGYTLRALPEKILRRFSSLSHSIASR